MKKTYSLVIIFFNVLNIKVIQQTLKSYVHSNFYMCAKNHIEQ